MLCIYICIYLLYDYACRCSDTDGCVGYIYYIYCVYSSEVQLRHSLLDLIFLIMSTLRKNKLQTPATLVISRPRLPGSAHFFHHNHAQSLLFRMRQTLRRSCDACAKSKLGCDLRTPRCSRCMKKDNFCVYANQPLTLSPDELPATPTKDFIGFEGHGAQLTRSHSQLVNQPIGGSFDPFDSYPRTRLARTHVERLIQHCESARLFDIEVSDN